MRLESEYEKSTGDVGPVVKLVLQPSFGMAVKMLLSALFGKTILYRLSVSETEMLAHNIARWQIVRMLREKKRGRHPAG